jgi:hypothetical protein
MQLPVKSIIMSRQDVVDTMLSKSNSKASLNDSKEMMIGSAEQHRLTN